ncbi:LOW QUALITY PROTEIN: Oxidoreductase, partial [Phytophthora megakarya]
GATGAVGHDLVAELALPQVSDTLARREIPETQWGNTFPSMDLPVARSKLEIIPVNFEELHRDWKKLPVDVDVAFSCLRTTRQNAGSASPETSAAVQKRKIRGPTARAMLAQGSLPRQDAPKVQVGARVRMAGREEYTSKTCSGCGVISNNLGGSEAFRCSSCRAVFDRDVNAARNIFHKIMGLL